jgi:hypothetical protein
MRTLTLSILGLGAALALGIVAALPGEAQAQAKQTCHFKGVWNGKTSDVVEFDAAYIYNHGEDDFTGVYNNPGISSANVVGSARKGVWNILLTYLGPKQGWVKKLVGKGALDSTGHNIVINGSFAESFNGGAPTNGAFVFSGQCH